MSFIHRVQQLIDQLSKGNASNFGRLIGKKQAQASALKNGQSKFSQDSLKILCRDHNINLNWLLLNKGSMFIEPMDQGKVSIKTEERDYLNYPARFIEELVDHLRATVAEKSLRIRDLEEISCLKQEKIDSLEQALELRCIHPKVKLS